MEEAWLSEKAAFQEWVRFMESEDDSGVMSWDHEPWLEGAALSAPGGQARRSVPLQEWLRFMESGQPTTDGG